MKIDNGTGGGRETSTRKPERVDERGRESINFFLELKRRNVDTNRRRQPLMRCVHKSDQLQVEPGSHDYDGLVAMITTNGIHIAVARLACSFLFLKNGDTAGVCHPLETGNAFCCVERSEWRA